MKENGEWYRLVTSMFIHNGLEHLIGNMIGILAFGWILEPVIGHFVGFFGGLLFGMVIILLIPKQNKYYLDN